MADPPLKANLLRLEESLHCLSRRVKDCVTEMDAIQGPSGVGA